jgi:hypothetical protein
LPACAGLLSKLIVIFGSLPFADAGFAQEQNEGVRLGQFLGKLSGPGAAGAQARRREEDV